MRSLAIAFIALLLAGASVHAAAPDDGLVAKTLGISSVSHTVKTQTNMGMTFSDVFYTDAQKENVVIVRMGTAEQYDLWRAAARTDALPMTGVGQDAFEYKGFGAVCAKSGAVGLCVTPGYRKTGKVTMQQARALMQAILPR